MKNLIIALVAIAALVIAGVILLKPKPVLKEAKSAEARGKYTEAINLYVKALLEKTEGMNLPDKNRSKIVSADDWFKEVQDYMSWVAAPPTSAPDEVSGIIVAISRCTTFVERSHFITDDSVFTHTQEFTLEADWRRAFFPRGVTVESAHGPLIRQAMTRGISILRITALTSYAYQASLLDLASWRRTDFTLAPEDEVSLLVRGGRYLLICSSDVEFPNGTLWHSPKSVIPITAPDSCSLETFVLKTRVKRTG
jgi:hypothetical protein